MEITSVRAGLLAAFAAAAWGTTYVVTGALLPPDRPLFSAVVRALPIGLVMLAWRRQLPQGRWWWRTAVLALCTIGLFFPLLFLGAYLLPGGLASTLQAASPLLVMAIAWPLLRERPTLLRVAAALVGLVGVTLLVVRAPSALEPWGVAAALASMTVSALGFVLIKRWPAPTDMITVTSWQLVMGGLVLLPIALVVEGAPPAIDVPAALGYAWIAVVGTGVAYVCWFTGLAHLPAAAVSLIGLVNPVVATVLGVIVMHEAFGAMQAIGAGLVLGSVLLGQPAIAERWRRRRAPEICPAA
ncbi:EamA family transporter [Pseudactinotalea suaedae]|uniref:EamA family transporter n=1 Tax=Pseudactinotalea suaedae TaxID=1524924 RepID=UPI0012E27B1D|nr:EamA family transporter [Pseudactinotalea suaedae]